MKSIETTKRKMKPGGGKAKGSSFERTAAKKLSDGLAPLNFRKTEGSGARTGGKNFETLGQMFGADALKLFVGDVCPINEKESGCTFNFSVECKSYATSDSFETMVGGNANVFKWMKESIVDAAKISRKPLLVFKWNRTPIYIAYLEESNLFKPNLVLSQNGLTLYINYFDEAIKHKEFWITS